MKHSTDVLVIGSGIAGLYFSLLAAERYRVTVVTKKQPAESNTNYAQGGIASVFDPDDKLESHIEDTIRAGSGLSHRDAVEVMVTEGPKLVEHLMSLGVEFSEGQQGFDLGKEGGHSKPRIVHAKDLTGKAIEEALLYNVRNHENITLLENHIAIDLITDRNLRSSFGEQQWGRCYGSYVLDKKADEVHTFLAKATMLATGGAGQVYLHTTNPQIATGAGVAMAYRIGAKIANMEFMQFHPTTLYHEQARSFLITEALRGFGGVLRTADGGEFMHRYDERKELAPRDIVARAIDSELKKRGDDCVYLDVTQLDAEAVVARFPTVHERCSEVGIDITRQQIPVVPSAHYSCGGVLSDLHGRTNIPGLHVCGEVAMTGVHGANRLASNSLLEALVFANRAAQHLLGTAVEDPPMGDVLLWDDSGTVNPKEWVLISHNFREVKATMWDYVGIVRSTERLERALKRVTYMKSEVEDFYRRTRVNVALLELRNLIQVAELIIRSALRREESRGLHYTIDYPETKPEYDGFDTVL